MTDQSALVLGGGGVAGIAWETGVLAGLAAGGSDVTGADLVIGTSAGAAVAAQVASGLSLEELFRRQVDPALQSEELTPPGSVAEVMDRMLALAGENPDPAEFRRRAGELALDTETVPEEARRKVIEGRLPVHEWPDRRLVITAVDVASGAPVVFDRESGVPLVDAVTASCAVPGIWPPVTIADARYMDGGYRTPSNADLAAGSTRIIILAPWVDPALQTEVAELTGSGSVVEVIEPDEASLAAFGEDSLDPMTRTPAAEAGYAQGRQAAAKIAGL